MEQGEVASGEERYNLLMQAVQKYQQVDDECWGGGKIAICMPTDFLGLISACVLQVLTIKPVELDSIYNMGKASANAADSEGLAPAEASTESGPPEPPTPC